MSLHTVEVEWSLGQGDFLARRYDRAHTLRFEGGLEVPGSPSPHVVPAPFSRADAMDPEAAFTASLSACHMLWFLDHAVQAGLIVTAYADQAEGTLARIAKGKWAMTKVVLRPAAVFAGAGQPDRETIDRLHHLAHESCFIANSVRTEVTVEPRECLPVSAAAAGQATG